MGIEIKDGTLRISAGYSLKVPSSVKFATEDAHMGLSLEFDVEGDATAIVDGSAPALQAHLANAVKFAVFQQLGVEFETDESGVLHPVLSEPVQAPAPVPAAAPASAQNPLPRNSQSGGGQPYTPPKADVTRQPAFIADLGEGLIEYYDLRSLKESGVFKPRAADFRPTRKGAGNQVWLTNKDGTPNEVVVAGLQAAGVAV